LATEFGLFGEGFSACGGVDEVGRGSVAGAISVGLVVVDARAGDVPEGLRDSKLLSPRARTALVPLIRGWALDCSVGHASAVEIDDYGLTAALRLAGHRALAQLRLVPDIVLLDGKHNWLTRQPQPGLFDPPYPHVEVPAVRTKIQADLTCASVAAASVLAKVERDARMLELSDRYPGYGWEKNMGYATPAHLAALSALGPSDEHRRTWNLPGVS
jgi:ribonuclease HII